MKRVRLEKKAPAKAERKLPIKRYVPEFNEQVERLCKLGVTDHEVAKFFSVTWRTVQNWKNQHPEFFVALQKGKLEADTEVAASLYKSANGYEYQEEQIVKKWRKKYNSQGQVTEAYEVIERIWVTKYAAPVPTSIIFYLKNRRPDLWRDAHLIKTAEDEQQEAEKHEREWKGPEEVQAELKRRGLVVLDGQYTVVSDGSGTPTK